MVGKNKVDLQLKEKYENEGIIIIKNFFSSKEVLELRNQISNENFSPNRKYIGFDEISFAQTLLNKIVNERLSSILNEIFIDPYIVPDFILQLSNTPETLPRPHYDLQSYIRQGMSKVLLSKDLQYAKIGLYLQDSGKENPGSIWYVPKSHKFQIFRFIWKLRIKGIQTRLDTFVKKLFRKYQIPLNASSGDLAIFDGRLLHSSAPKILFTSKTELKKMSIYFSAVGSLKNANNFMKNEIYKLADEINSKDPDDCQRIGYFFGSLSSILKNHCSHLDLKFFSLDSKFLNSNKNKIEKAF
tara:strand:- start:983 stop:1879 length:897 start_codon:yes stop_codon:yes gene_type:complete